METNTKELENISEQIRTAMESYYNSLEDPIPELSEKHADVQ